MTSHRIYILPTRSWAVLLAVLAAMWYAAISQSNSAAYLLMFFLSSMVLVTADPRAFRAGRICGCGSSGSNRFSPGKWCRCRWRSRTRRAGPGLALAVAPKGRVFKETFHAPLGNLEGESSQTTRLTLPTTRRGQFELGRLALTTVYPMGFLPFLALRAHRHLLFGLPGAGRFAAFARRSVRSPPTPWREPAAGGDDYVGARPYQSGESQRHVDWKAVARGQPLLVKQFAGAGSRRLWLEYSSVAHFADPEARLSQSGRLDRRCRSLGLRLRPAGAGLRSRTRPGPVAHYHRCLAALARFEGPSPA